MTIIRLCLSAIVDDGVNILANFPIDAKIWSKTQYIKAKQQLEDIKNNICSDFNPVKEMAIEKIIYVDRIVEVKVPAKMLKRRCITKKTTDNFGNSGEIMTCTEWK
jgi:hypothetical protein